ILRNRAAVRELHRVVHLEAGVDVVTSCRYRVRRGYRSVDFAVGGSPGCTVGLIRLAVGAVARSDPGEVRQRGECRGVLPTTASDGRSARGRRDERDQLTFGLRAIEYVANR